MKISIDLSDLQPTHKQVEFVHTICDALDLDLPEMDRLSVEDFLNERSQEYYDYVALENLEHY